MIKNHKNLIFIDIETASARPSLEALEPAMQELWLKKAQFLTENTEKDDAQFYFDRAAI